MNWVVWKRWADIGVTQICVKYMSTISLKFSMDYLMCVLFTLQSEYIHHACHVKDQCTHYDELIKCGLFYLWLLWHLIIHYALQIMIVFFFNIPEREIHYEVTNSAHRTSIFDCLNIIVEMSNYHMVERRQNIAPKLLSSELFFLTILWNHWILHSKCWLRMSLLLY